MSNRLPRIIYYSDAVHDYFIHIEEIEFRTFDRFQIDHLASYTILMQSAHIYFQSSLCPKMGYIHNLEGNAEVVK